MEPPGATLSIAITAGVTIGVTAHDVGPFSQQPIDHQTLSTQLYIAVAALTTLFLSAVVSERERSSRELAEARRGEGERAVEERRRIARDLHDSVSQALFSTVLHTRTAQKALAQEGRQPLGPGRTIPRRDRGAHQERAERDARAHLRAAPRPRRTTGWSSALAGTRRSWAPRDAPSIDGPRADGRASRCPQRRGGPAVRDRREALANVVKHAGPRRAGVGARGGRSRSCWRSATTGSGFDPSAKHPGHFGLESMRSRAAEIGGRLTIASRPGSRHRRPRPGPIVRR